MYRKINKGRSITKILIYSVILTWFTIILAKNWRDMRISWFKEVWDFIDFKAVGRYIEDHLGLYIIFGAGIFTVYCVVAMFARTGRYGGVNYEDFEGPDDSYAKDMTRRQYENEDHRNNPAYHYLPGNIWHQKMKRKKKDEEP